MAALSACEFALSPPNLGRGVSCDESGAFIDSIPLLRKRYSSRGEVWEPRDCESLSGEIGKRYGLPIDFSSRQKGLCALAAALNEGNIAKAQLVALFLNFPTSPQFSNADITQRAATKFVHELSANGLIKVWDPDEHPRWPAHAPDSQGGRFAPKDVGLQVADADLDPEDDEVENEISAEARSRANWSAAEAAGREEERERAAEAEGGETPRMSRSRIERNRSARERREFWKNEFKKDPSLRALDSLLSKPENLSLMGRGRAPIGDDGFPMELHHPEGDPDAEVVPMTQTEHRRGENYLRNHPWLRPKKKRMVDIYASEVNRVGNLGAFFEADERVGWLYLCHVFENGDIKIIKPLNILNRTPDFAESDVQVRWFDDDRKVGVVIKGQLYGYFDVASGREYRGRYPNAPLKWPSQ